MVYCKQCGGFADAICKECGTNFEPDTYEADAFRAGLRVGLEKAAEFASWLDGLDHEMALRSLARFAETLEARIQGGETPWTDHLADEDEEHPNVPTLEDFLLEQAYRSTPPFPDERL